MNVTTAIKTPVENAPPANWLLPLLAPGMNRAERTKAIETVLSASGSRRFRGELADWVLQFIPADALVPDLYARWRPLVRDAMRFMLSHLSIPRLAPKLAEQIELPLSSKPEMRLLRLIAKFPGLQKLGQVLARNRHLPPALRRALSQLENGISDVGPSQIRAIIHEELGSQLERFVVQIEPTIFFEGSVSAVVRFRWWNPDLQCRERAVFKVLKPHISQCFAEDMDLLAQLAKYMGSRHQEYGFAPHVLFDTFNDVRRLLQHEVKFTREQSTLTRAAELYSSLKTVRVPRVIQCLCTSKITAVTEEQGKKITEAVRGMPDWQRVHVAEQLVNALIAAPLFARAGDAMFHADPHAGNLLYDRRRGELVILDWALTDSLTSTERRYVAMLFLMIILRDPVGASQAIEGLSSRRGRREKFKAGMIRACVTSFLNELPVKRMPGAVDAMNLLQAIAFEGIRLPTSLVMFRKALFTLDGILHDIRAPEFSIESVVGRRVLQNWLMNWEGPALPLSFGDWMLLPCSALLFPGRLLLQAAQNMLRPNATLKPVAIQTRIYRRRPSTTAPRIAKNPKRASSSRIEQNA